LFSAFSKIQHEPTRLGEAWARGNEVISAVNVPAFLGMAVVAPDFVPVIIGLHWGVVGVAASFAITRFILAPIQTHITCRTLGVSPRFVRGEALVVGLGVAMAAAVGVARLG